MRRFWEFIFGLDKGFLGREGELGVDFNPHWPWQETVGAGMWNLLLGAAALLLVWYVYRREGRSRPVRITLGVCRMLLLAFVLALLNRPVLTLVQSRVEPSVLPILVDESVSMRVKDVAFAPNAPAMGRLEAVIELLNGQDRALLKELSKTHEVRLYRFSSDAQPLPAGEAASNALATLTPTGANTQVMDSILSVLRDVQGQRVAGVVVMTDGRDTPAKPMSDAINRMKEFGARIYPIAVGSDQSPRNVDVQGINVQDTAFSGDIVNVKAIIRGSGYGPGHTVHVVLKEKGGAALRKADGSPVEQTISLVDDKPMEVELQFKPEKVGTLDFVVEATKQAGELDEEDNVRPAQVAVLDAKIAVLLIDGYPRWEYRYVKNEMIRDKTVEISCWLTSADEKFAQEGDKPITRLPNSIEELMAYDVVLIGDVDPRQFTDRQLQLIHDFVNQKGGGLGMIAGPRFSPQAFRSTPIEAILPVGIARVQGEEITGSITQGFRPVLTKIGADSSLFRFVADRATNRKYLRDEIQQIFWYCRGAMAKQGLGEVYAEHPTDTGPDGRKAPLLVLGRFGAGRTLFSAIDDSWRWRYYTGESVFDTYWVQQIRYLARSKKLGQRRLTLNSTRTTYELGEQVRINLRILDPVLLQQLPTQLRVEVQDAVGQMIRSENLIRQDGSSELYTGSFTADRVGNFVVKLPPIAGGVDMMDLPIETIVPRLELVQPQIDRTQLSRLASETLGESIELASARTRLPLIPSAAKTIPILTSQPLWDAPLAMILFVVLITMEWVLRKMYGML